MHVPNSTYKTEDETTHEILYHTFLLARFQQTNVTSSRFLDSLFLLTSIWLLLLYSLVISSSPLCSCLKFCHVGTSRVGCSGLCTLFFLSFIVVLVLCVCYDGEWCNQPQFGLLDKKYCSQIHFLIIIAHYLTYLLLKLRSIYLKMNVEYNI